MLLSGHGDQVLTVRFSPGEGKAIASGSHDKRIFLWQTYGECDNYAVLTGHKNAVIELHWLADGEHLVSCSSDKTVRTWDAVTGEAIARLNQHKAIVNSCHPIKRGPPLVVSGSDDCTARVWDTRARGAARTLSERFPITAVCMSEGGDQVYTGGIENVVRVWDLRRDEPILTLQGHQDTITGMSLSPDGTRILSNSMDNTLRMWDVRPFAPSERCVQIFKGHQHGFERSLLRCSWSPDGSKVTSGSADRVVYMWNASTAEIQYALPGHKGSVLESIFHPKEPIVASCSADKTIYLGELA